MSRPAARTPPGRCAATIPSRGRGTAAQRMPFRSQGQPERNPSMIDHLGITVTNFDASKAFYDKAMAPLGASLLMLVPPEYTGGVKVGGYGRDRPSFWISEGERQTDHQHVAFTARSRAEVDAFHEAAIAAGGRDNGA